MLSRLLLFSLLLGLALGWMNGDPRKMERCNSLFPTAYCPNWRGLYCCPSGCCLKNQLLKGIYDESEEFEFPYI